MLEINTIVVSIADVLGAVKQSTMTQVGVKKENLVTDFALCKF